MKFDLCFAILIVALVATFASCSERTTAQLPEAGQNVVSANAVNINTASAEELEAIPHIGPKIAHDIIEFRERHGRFQRPEQLLLIRGFSDTRYRQIRDFIKTE